MSYEISANPEGLTVRVSAENREQLFRDVLSATLEAAYGDRQAAGAYEGQVVPVQAVGSDEESLVSALVEGSVRAARESDGTLQPPRWLAFDTARVTANLPVTLPRRSARDLHVTGIRLAGDAGALSATLKLEPAAHH